MQYTQAGDDDMITEREYITEINAIAENVRSEVRDEDGREEYDLIHEAIDCHYWLIYCAYTPYVLVHSRNDDAGFDSMGDDVLQGCNTTSEVMTRLAYYAMEQDIAEALGRLPEPEEA